MHILIVVHQFFPRWYTGTERMALNNARQLIRMGHTVEVLTYGITDELIEFSKEIGGCLVREYFVGTVRVTAIKQKTIPADIDFRIFHTDTEEVLTRIIAEKKPDILHICHPSRLGSVSKIARTFSIPVVLTVTDLWLICPKAIAITDDGTLCQGSEGGSRCLTLCSLGQDRETILKRQEDSVSLLGSVDRVVFATTFLQAFYRKHTDLPNTSMIRFGIDYAVVRKNTRRYAKGDMLTFGFLSVLTPHKGAHILIEAFSRVACGNARLKVHGSYFWNTHYNDTLQSLAGRDPRIEFCGPYDYEHMPQILSETDVLVLPSLWWENSPLVLLTACAHGVPAIVTDLGGMTEIVRDTINGWSFPAGDVSALARVLETVCSDPSVLNTMKEHISHPPRIEEESFAYERLFDHVLQGRTGKP